MDNSKFSPAQIKQLKEQYSKIDKIDPSSTTYKNLIKLLNSLSQPQLKQLAGLDIKFISALARNRANLWKPL
jgi:hypothetical protein